MSQLFASLLSRKLGALELSIIFDFESEKNWFQVKIDGGASFAKTYRQP
jgi:hypothetical protein